MTEPDNILLDAIRRHSIQNRLKYGKAEVGSVLSKVVSEKPKAKKSILQTIAKVRDIVAEVNSLPQEKLGGYELDETGKREHTPGLTLPNPEKVVLRFAPNPNGPPTLGSARGIIVNSELAVKYNGRFILRFDDTDPKLKKPMLEAYGWYLEDCLWLGAKPEEVITASERIDSYYKYAEDLILEGNAYVCFCSQPEFKELKDNGKPCNHRNASPENNLKEWKKMLSGGYGEKTAVLRIKTDLQNPDPALRDWVAFRILNEEHPKVGRRYVVWPMLDFESAIEDHILGITHILRGKDLMDCEGRQKFIYRYLNWTYPETILWGRVKIEEFGRLSTSEIKKGIDEGVYNGWDDPKLPTIRALKRRGITSKAIRNLMISLGIGENDISISLENLYSENRKILDPTANRYFFVSDPVELEIENANDLNVKMPMHPTFKDRGNREFNLKAQEDRMTLYIPSEDASQLKENQAVRLMNLFNAKISRVGEKKVYGARLEEKRLDVSKIHWVQEHVRGELVTPEKVISGFCEPACGSLNVSDVVQFERVGFARLDAVKTTGGENTPVFYFAHR